MRTTASGTPRVSIVIPCYNRIQYIGETIDSVVAQTFSDWELIVIDDGSTDGSESLVRTRVNSLIASGLRATFIARENRGHCRTLNEGLSLARGELFCYLGSDDLWHPSKLERQISALDGSPDRHAAAYSDCWVIDAAGRRIGRRGALHAFRGGDIYHDLILSRYFPPSPTNLFVTAVVREIGGFEESLPMEDYPLWIRIARNHRVLYVGEPLASYRVHEQSMTSNEWQTLLPAFVAAAIRFAEEDPALRPLRKRIEAQRRVINAGFHFNAMNFRAARLEAIAALRLQPTTFGAWRILAASLLGARVVRAVRSIRQKKRQRALAEQEGARR